MLTFKVTSKISGKFLPVNKLDKTMNQANEI